MKLLKTFLAELDLTTKELLCSKLLIKFPITKCWFLGRYSPIKAKHLAIDEFNFFFKQVFLNISSDFNFEIAYSFFGLCSFDNSFILIFLSSLV